ncbi:MAG: SIMPL domain-containing protein [Christensenellales bacterium]|jgi:uncharacterized protein YggE
MNKTVSYISLGVIIALLAVLAFFTFNNHALLLQPAESGKSAYVEQGTDSGMPSVQQANTIKATGTHTLYAAPDKASFTVSVVTQDADAAKAQEKNAQAMEALMQALKDSEPQSASKPNEFQTSGYSVYPEYDYRTGNVITGYSVQNAVRVTIYDLDSLSVTLDAAAQNGANRIDGITFLIDDDQALYRQALQEAVRIAQANAEALAKGANTGLKGVLSVQEGVNYEEPRYYVSMDNGLQKEAAMDGGYSIPLEHGSLQISATVTLVYEMN